MILSRTPGERPLGITAMGVGVVVAVSVGGIGELVCGVVTTLEDVGNTEVAVQRPDTRHDNVVVSGRVKLEVDVMESGEDEVVDRVGLLVSVVSSLHDMAVLDETVEHVTAVVDGVEAG